MPSKENDLYEQLLVMGRDRFGYSLDEDGYINLIAKFEGSDGLDEEEDDNLDYGDDEDQEDDNQDQDDDGDEGR